jgi:hypothetical protein
MVESYRRLFLYSQFFQQGNNNLRTPQGSPRCQKLVGNLLGENFYRGIWNIWGRAHLGFFCGCGKEQYYLVDNYEDQYMIWTTLQQEKIQTVSQFKNTFHTLRTKLAIKDSEWHLDMKYHGALHSYIQTKMDFLNISSLGFTYRYIIKIKYKFRHQNKWEFKYLNTKQPKHGKYDPRQPNYDNQYKTQENKGKGKTKNDTGKWCYFHKIPWHNINECRSKQSLMAEVKDKELNPDLESDPKIIENG